MAQLILNKGDIVSLKVTNIKNTTKVVNKQTGTFYQYHITMEDKKGDFVMCEYLSPGQDQDKFYLGVMQFIEVKFISQKGTPEIEPCEEPQKVMRTPGQDSPRVSAGNTSHVDVPGKKNAQVNCASVNATGRGITYSVAYAKDLLVAEITANPRKITDDDIDRMMKWADTINQGICDRINF